jgi:hypothetical protein
MLYAKSSLRKILKTSYSDLERQFSKGRMLILKSMSSSFINVLDTPCVLQQFTMSKVVYSMDKVLPSYKDIVAVISNFGFKPESGIWPNSYSRSSSLLCSSSDASHSCECIFGLTYLTPIGEGSKTFYFEGKPYPLGLDPILLAPASRSGYWKSFPVQCLQLYRIVGKQLVH